MKILFCFMKSKPAPMSSPATLGVSDRHSLALLFVAQDGDCQGVGSEEAFWGFPQNQWLRTEKDRAAKPKGWRWVECHLFLFFPEAVWLLMNGCASVELFVHFSGLDFQKWVGTACGKPCTLTEKGNCSRTCMLMSLVGFKTRCLLTIPLEAVAELF